MPELGQRGWPEAPMRRAAWVRIPLPALFSYMVEGF
jgi:hypothetical protein